MYGSCWPDMAIKTRTSVCNLLGEKLNVGMRNLRYGRTPLRSNPGCGFKCPLVCAACAVAGFGEPTGDEVGKALGDGVARAALSIAAACSGVFSPLRDGSCRNLNNQFGST